MKKIFLFILSLSMLFSCSKDSNTSGDTSSVTPPITSGAEVNTNVVSSITCNSASFSGLVKDSVAFIEKGIVFSTTSQPTVSNNKLVDSRSGTLIAATTVLLAPSTKYFYRAFITKAGGVVIYGGEGSFTTPECGSSGGGSGGGSGGANLIIDSNFYMEIQIDGQTHFLKQGTIGSDQCMLSHGTADKIWGIVFKKDQIANGVEMSGRIPDLGSTSMKFDKSKESVVFIGNISAPNSETNYESTKHITRSKVNSSCNRTDNGYQPVTINLTKKEFVTGKGFRYLIRGGEFNEFNLNLAGIGGTIYEGTITGTLVKDNISKECVSDELKSYSARFRLIAVNL